MITKMVRILDMMQQWCCPCFTWGYTRLKMDLYAGWAAFFPS